MTSTPRAFVASLAALWLAAATGAAAQSTPLTAGASTPLTAGGYDAGGRRDPFVSLIQPPKPAPKPRAAVASRPAAGLAGIAVSDVQVKGVVRSGATFVALLEGPDGRTFLAKRLDRLVDGVVKGIERDAVVFTERVEDAAGAIRQRDVRKALKVSVAGGQS